MKLEEQVSSLELSRTLKNLGVRQESAFCWQEKPRVLDGGSIEPSGTFEIRSMDNRMKYGFHAYIAAFTVAELGEMLPGRIRLDSQDVWLWTTTGNDNEFWEVRYKGSLYEEDDCIPRVQEITESNARAKMLIHLIEQGIVNPKES